MEFPWRQRKTESPVLRLECSMAVSEKARPWIGAVEYVADVLVVPESILMNGVASSARQGCSHSQEQLGRCSLPMQESHPD